MTVTQELGQNPPDYLSHYLLRGQIPLWSANLIPLNRLDLGAAQNHTEVQDDFLVINAYAVWEKKLEELRDSHTYQATVVQECGFVPGSPEFATYQRALQPIRVYQLHQIHLSKTEFEAFTHQTAFPIDANKRLIEARISLGAQLFASNFTYHYGQELFRKCQPYLDGVFADGAHNYKSFYTPDPNENQFFRGGSGLPIRGYISFYTACAMLIDMKRQPPHNLPEDILETLRQETKRDPWLIEQRSKLMTFCSC